MSKARTALVLFLSLYALTATGAGANAEQRHFLLHDGTALLFQTPTEWVEVSERESGERAYTGPRMRMTLTPAHGQGTSVQELRDRIAKRAASEARLNKLIVPTTELLGTESSGFYFRSHASGRKKAAYRTEGAIMVGGVQVSFAIVTGDAHDEVIYQALGVLRGVRRRDAQMDHKQTPVAQNAGWRSMLKAASGPYWTTLLGTGDFSQLDADLSAYQAAYRAGEIDDETASAPFIELVQSDPGHRAAYDRWLAAYPDSYVAHIARGYYLAALGYQARGSGFVTETSTAEFREMRAYFDAASHDLERALTLDAKPTLAYGTLLWIAQGGGGKAQRDRMLHEALALDSRTYTARASYFASLRPEWGGSLGEMQVALQQWEGQITAEQHARFKSMLDGAFWKGALQSAQRLVDAERYREAIAEYDKAIASGAGVRGYAMRGYSYAQMGDHRQALADYERALELDPDGGCCPYVESNRVRSYMAIGEIEKGIALLRVAAAKGNADAMREYGLIYAYGKHGVKRDFVVARQWCEQAAIRNDAVSMYCLGGLYHSGLGVEKNVREAARWFERAAQRGITDAQADLAWMLWAGQGVQQDRDAAIRWWRTAAKKGNKRAAAQLKKNLSAWEYWMEVTLPDFIAG